jgi:AraC-like DNA-binding protein
MKLQIKYDLNTTTKVVLQEQLERLEIPYQITGFGEIEITSAITDIQQHELKAALSKYGIEILDNPKNMIVQKIKNAIIEMVYLEDKLLSSKTSDFIAGKLNLSYGHLAALFSEVTYTSIENYIILQKIELAKNLIIEGKLTLTEISYKLNYSSVAHLSNQFKKTTGLTPSAFKRIIDKRASTDLQCD